MAAGNGNKTLYVGDEAQSQRGHLSLRRPIERGRVVDWDAMESFWGHMFATELRVASNEHPLIMVEPAMSPTMQRDKTTELMFERFETPALLYQASGVLSMYASGRCYGLAFECGDGVTQAMPIFGGFTAPASIRRQDLAGDDVTQTLRRLLRERNYACTTSAEHEIVRDVKEKLAFVAADFGDTLELARCSTVHEQSYELPDGQTIAIDNERFRCAEALFQPSLIGSELMGLGELLCSSIRACDIDLRRQMVCSRDDDDDNDDPLNKAPTARSSQAGNIVFCGGTSFCSGIVDRLRADVSARLPSTLKVNVVASPERRVAAWIGGSIVGSMSTLREWCATRAEYDESGPVCARTVKSM